MPERPQTSDTNRHRPGLDSERGSRKPGQGSGSARAPSSRMARAPAGSPRGQKAAGTPGVVWRLTGALTSRPPPLAFPGLLRELRSALSAGGPAASAPPRAKRSSARLRGSPRAGRKQDAASGAAWHRASGLRALAPSITFPHGLVGLFEGSISIMEPEIGGGKETLKRTRSAKSVREEGKGKRSMSWTETNSEQGGRHEEITLKKWTVGEHASCPSPWQC